VVCGAGGGHPARRLKSGYVRFALIATNVLRVSKTPLCANSRQSVLQHFVTPDVNAHCSFKRF
jgi:hypothetical protein